MTQYTPRWLSDQLIIGLVLVAIGALLLFRTTGVYDAVFLLEAIPLVFVFIGLYAIVASRFQNLAGPAVLILVAGSVQLVIWDVIEGTQVIDLWPLLIVVVGLSMLFGHFGVGSDSVDSEWVNGIAIFGGNNQRVTGASFTGAGATAIFGDVTLDLRETSVTDPPARIRSTVLFGDVDIIVPPEWNVRIDILPILGDVVDDRKRVDEKDQTDTVDLVVTGFVAFADLQVKE